MATDSRDVSRRQFVLGLGPGLIVGGSGAAANQTLKPPVPVSPASVTIDPNTIRRRGAGCDPRSASPGFTLFASLTGPGIVYLSRRVIFQLHFGSEPPGLFAAAVRFLA